MTSDLPEAPPLERRLHPAATAIDGLRHARGAATGALVVLVSQGLVVGGIITAGLLTLATFAAFLNWRTTRYAVIDDTLRLRTGLFSRHERNIPASRISALDTSRGILQRIFGVVAVHVQTAGGGKEAEISLRAVSFAEAERLRRELGHRAPRSASDGRGPDAADGVGDLGFPGDAGPTSDASFAATGPRFTNPAGDADHLAPDESVVYAITPRELVLAALTSPSVAVAGAASAAIFSLASDALPSRLQRQLATSVDELTLTAVIVLAIVGLLLAAVVSVIGTILMFGGFRVTRDDRRLRVRRGLLTERVGTIPLGRIHGVRIVESPLRQLLGLAAIEVEVAGYAGQDEVTRTLVPLINRDAIPALLADIVPAIAWPDRPLEPVPVRARRRYLTLPLVVTLPFATALLVAPIGWLRIVAIVPLGIGVLVGSLQARAAGWLLAGGTFTIRSRRFARSTLLAQSSRLQRAEFSTSPFQRRANLGTIAVRLSNARRGQIRHLDATEIHELLQRLGRTPETPAS